MERTPQRGVGLVETIGLLLIVSFFHGWNLETIARENFELRKNIFDLQQILYKWDPNIELTESYLVTTLDLAPIRIKAHDYSGARARITMDEERHLVLTINEDEEERLEICDFKTVLEALSKMTMLGFKLENLTADERSNQLFRRALQNVGFDVKDCSADEPCRIAVTYELQLDGLLEDTS